MTTLEQLRTTWSLVDLVEANEAQDALEQAKAGQKQPTKP